MLSWKLTTDETKKNRWTTKSNTSYGEIKKTKLQVSGRSKNQKCIKIEFKKVTLKKVKKGKL